MGVGTTLFGYTEDTADQKPPAIQLLPELRHELKTSVRLICEGGISTPTAASDALAAGADNVVVGTAITGVDLQVAAYCRKMAGWSHHSGHSHTTHPGHSHATHPGHSHATHSTHGIAATLWSRGFRFGFVGNHNLGSDQQRGNGHGVLHGQTHYFPGINNAGSHQILIGPIESIESVAAFAHRSDHDISVLTGVGGDLVNRCSQSALNDFNACALVAVELFRHIAEAVSQLEECASAPGDDALLDGCPGGVESIFDPQLAVVQFRLGGSSDLDHRNTPGQFGDAFVQFFPVVIGVCRLQFTFDRGHAVGYRGTVIVRGNDRAY